MQKHNENVRRNGWTEEELEILSNIILLKVTTHINVYQEEAYMLVSHKLKDLVLLQKNEMLGLKRRTLYYVSIIQVKAAMSIKDLMEELKSLV